VSKNVDKRRIYVDLKGNRVFSINTQYAGNSVGLKKLSLRLAIKKADKEGWLCEHMFVMGAKSSIGKINYFTGAFPSACGKTSTAMIPGQTIVGDDITYLKNTDGKVHAVNPEQGIFGIIENINPIDDALIYKSLTTPRELIFSNVLMVEDIPYWEGMGKDLPTEGVNHAGKWKKGDKDKVGNEILAANKNSRYTIRLEELENVDSNVNNPEGVPISGVIFGGRDPNTSPPVVESFGWEHGVLVGASLESETTATILGKTGVRTHNPMANLDFLVIPFGKYINNYLKFGAALTNKPKIFSTNYFLKEGETFLNNKVDKKVWLMWMNGRVNGDYGSVKTPIGFIPKFEDLKLLFKEIFDKEYMKGDYEKQFSIRINKLLERLDRIAQIFKEEADIPKEMWDQIELQKQGLNELKNKLGKEVVSPFEIN
jgi:phosphoenolpyruvate carboxykinase (GTP)